MASLWHAPVPWIHIHGSPAAGSLSNAYLDHHLGEFHANFAPSQVAELGWHMHLVLPWSIHHQGDCDQDHNGQSCNDVLAGVKYGTARATPNGNAQSHDSFRAGGDRWIAITHDAPPADLLIPQSCRSEVRPPLGFFASFLGSVSICDLIDRHLC